jgi:hypothetical protein
VGKGRKKKKVKYDAAATMAPTAVSVLPEFMTINYHDDIQYEDKPHHRYLRGIYHSHHHHHHHATVTKSSIGITLQETTYRRCKM